MLIEVTQDDIEKGIAEDCERCSVARAIARITGLRASVDDTTILVGKGFDVHRYNSPASVRCFIRDFDQMLGGKPFSFELSDEPRMP